jgi:UDP-galactopyranose mutase
VKTDKTIVTTETPIENTRKTVPYYPLNDDRNNRLYRKYKKEADKLTNYVFGGRLADYKYYDMDQVIGSSLRTVEKEIKD